MTSSSSQAPTRASGSQSAGRVRTGPAVWLAFSLALVFAIPLATAALAGSTPYDELLRAFPGFDVAVVTAGLQAGADAAALLSFGALIWLLIVRDATPATGRHVPDGRELRLLQWSSAAWVVCAGGLVVFTALDASGMPLLRLLEPGALGFLYRASYLPGAWTFSFAAALIVCVAAWFASRWTGFLVPLWASVVGLLAPVVVGQVLVGPDHDFGSDAAVFQTLAVNAGFGPLIVVALRVGCGERLSAASIRKLWTLLSVTMPVVVVTDAIISTFKLAGSGLFDSTTGMQIVGRWGVLAILLGLVVWTARRWSVGRLSERGLVRSVSLATPLIATWVGLGAAMTRVPPPQYFVPTSVSQILLGFDVPDPPTFQTLVTVWRPNLLFIGLAVAAIAVYLVAVRTLRARGDTWPRARIAAWIGGWCVVVVVTSSGFGKYSAPDFAIHMIVHMSLNMLAPGLLVLGGVVTLLLRASQARHGSSDGVHDWITRMLHWRVLTLVYNPLIVFVVFVGSYYGLYLSGAFGELMRFHWGHQLMNLHFLIVGYLYYGLIVGVDRPPRPLPHIGKLGYVLAAMPFHAFFGVILMTSSTIIAESFYQYLDLPWADLEAAQYAAGGIAWAGGEFPLMIVIVVLASQWRRHDAKVAARKDRHFDTGRDDEFELYNQMLGRLAERSRTQLADENRKEPQS